MNESKHTPGPWAIETREHVHAVCCEPKRKGEHPEVCFVEVAACQFPGKPPDDLSAGSITAQQRTKEELLANARLIASAPELLAALEKCAGIVENESGMGQWGAGLSEYARCELSSRILAAIALATRGES